MCVVGTQQDIELRYNIFTSNTHQADTYHRISCQAYEAYSKSKISSSCHTRGISLERMCSPFSACDAPGISSEPHPGGEQPHPEGEQPHPEGKQPHSEGEQPHPEGKQPHPEGEQPHPEGEQPHPEGEQPYPEGEQRHAEGEQPHAEGEQPNPEGEQLHAEGEQPHAEGERCTSYALYTVQHDNPPLGRGAGPFP